MFQFYFASILHFECVLFKPRKAASSEAHQSPVVVLSVADNQSLFVMSIYYLKHQLDTFIFKIHFYWRCLSDFIDSIQ